MAFAIISDLHSNLSALEAVFNDIDVFSQEVRIDEIFCLGDIIGYGCQPVEVLNLLSKRVENKNIIRGNHEEIYWGNLSEDVDYKALLMISYNKFLIDQNDLARELMQSLALTTPEYKSLKKGRFNIMLSHNGPDAEYTNYRLPWNVEVLLPSLFREFQEANKPERSFWSFLSKKPRNLFFFGHTHFPTLFSIEKEDGSGKAIWSKPKLSFKEDFSDSEFILINPGSVGYPRDGNPKASYMIVDEKRDVLYHRRVPYEFDSSGYGAAKDWLKENYLDRHELGPIKIEDLVERVHKTAKFGVFGANKTKLPNDWKEYYQQIDDL